MSGPTALPTAAAAPADERSVRPRWPQIEGLRALAATLVFATHAWMILGGETARLVDSLGSEAVRVASPFFLHSGQTGVALFYAISGFLLYTPFVRARQRGETLGLASYAIRRAARIVPAYWLALIVIGVATGNDRIFTPRGIVDYFLFMEIWTPLDLQHLLQPVTNDPFGLARQEQFLVISGNPVKVAWTLCVEVSFYVFLPFWAWGIARVTAARRRPFRTEALIIGAVMVASLIWKVVALNRVADVGFDPWLMILPNSIDIFAVGMLLALLAARSTTNGWPRPLQAMGRRPATCWIAAIVIFTGVCLLESRWSATRAESWFPVDLDGYLHWQQGIWGELNVVLAALLLAPVVVAADHRNAPARFLDTRAMAWIGIVSYGLYLWHVFVLERIDSAFGSDGVPLALAPAAAVVAYLLSLAVAAASWYVMERRVLALAHRTRLVRVRRRPARSG